MDGQKLFTHRVNLLFGFGSLLPVVMGVTTVISAFLSGLFSQWDGCPFWLLFVLPQALYPVLSALVFFFAYRMFGFKVKDTVKNEKSGFGAYFLYVPMVIFLSVLLSSLVNIIFNLFRSIGIALPTVSSSLPVPSGPVESIALVVVMAVLPALCEEFIYRLTFVGLLSPLSRGGAIVVSSIAFGLMHGTVEQIFATFCLGVCFAFIYVYTGNYRIPVVMHFVNNFISCLFIILSGYLSDSAYAAVNVGFSVLIFVAGMISVVVFLLTKRTPLPESPAEIKTGKALVLAFKAPMFWLFVAVYVCVTVVNTVLLSVPTV